MPGKLELAECTYCGRCCGIVAIIAIVKTVVRTAGHTTIAAAVSSTPGALSSEFRLQCAVGSEPGRVLVAERGLIPYRVVLCVLRRNTGESWGKDASRF